MSSKSAVSRLGEGDAEGGAPRGHTRPLPIHPVHYPLVFVGLLVLSAGAVVVAVRRFEDWRLTLAAIVGVALVQAVLVSRYFMHLKYEGRLITLALFFPMLLCAILTVALIPDIGMGRRTSMSDPVEAYERPSPGLMPGMPTPKFDSHKAE
ncbi:MAG: hypothetical protein JWO31_1050 [Phycisphaerales bacterium]|nr:hypothetical protein [Phycisphaerales bacterium]